MDTLDKFWVYVKQPIRTMLIVDSWLTIRFHTEPLYETASAQSSPRMNLLMQAFQPLTGDVGVDLGAGKIGMSQHDLYTAQISAVFQQMGGKGMPQSVG
jgi:hypothetical protein